jgi:hypothetical protein
MTVALQRNRAGDRLDALRRFAPAIAMFVLAPVIAVALLGATPVSTSWTFLVHLPFYGAGVLLIRELVRRRGLGWSAILLMGAAFGTFHEGVVLQTIWRGDLFAADMGHALGANYVWGAYIVVYHMFWSVTLPILVVELLFRDRRAVSWLPGPALFVVGALFALGVALEFRFIATAYPATNPLTPAYRWPFAGMALCVAVSALFVWLALRTRGSTETPPETLRPAPSPWLLLPFGFLCGVVWFMLLGLAQFHLLPPAVALVVGGIVLAGVLLLLRSWTAPDRNWTDLHWVALCIGRLLIDGLFGVWQQVPLNHVYPDLVAQVGVLVALDGLVVIWWRRVSRRLRERRAEGLSVAMPAQAWKRPA